MRLVILLGVLMLGCSAEERASDGVTMDAGLDGDGRADAPDGDDCDLGPCADVDTGTVVADVPLMAAAPAFDPAPGTYACPQRISLSTTTAAAIIHYTLDETTPDASSPQYTGAIAVTSTRTIKAIAFAAGHTPSDVTSGEYRIDIAASLIEPIAFSPPGGSYATPQTVTLSTTTPSTTICYTTNGDAPGCDPFTAACIGTTYTAPFSVTPTAAGTTIRATGCKPCHDPATMSTATYRL